MGAVISILRPKEQDTSSQLAEIETKLKTLGEKRARVLRRREALYTKTRKYGLGLFSVLLMGLYLTVPDDSIERFIQIVCVFIIYPVTVLLLRKFWKYYYDRRLSKADDEIKPLEKKKEWLLKSVMEKEPYNKAREILKRYGANQFEVPKPPGSTQNQRKKLVNGKPIDSPINLQGRPLNSTIAEASPATRKFQQHPQSGVQLPKPNGVAKRHLSQTIGGMSPIMRTPQNGAMVSNTPQVRKTVKKTVRPLPSEKLNQSNIEKMVDWVVGSKPEQMYALICKNCKNHNGLAIKEEFEYMEWRCAYCHNLNMATKQRPAPPQLTPQRPADAYLSNTISPPITQPHQKVSNQMKGEDSGTESDQMEKKTPVSKNEDENEAEHHNFFEESLDESILAGHPTQKELDDKTLENNQ